MTRPATRRRNKLAPDPDVRRAILAAASEIVREQGVRGLSIAAVLDRAELSTRAFYRHFESKDQLVAAVFLEMARRREARRLQKENGEGRRPGRGGGRLDRRATRPGVRREDQIRSAPACRWRPQSQMFASPELIQPAYAEMLKPLVEATARVAWIAVSFTTSIRWPTRSPSRAWCGRALNGNGRQAIADRARGPPTCSPLLLARTRRHTRNDRRHRSRATDVVRSNDGPGFGRIESRRDRRQQGHGAGDRANPGGRRGQRRGDGPGQGGARRRRSNRCGRPVLPTPWASAWT